MTYDRLRGASAAVTLFEAMGSHSREEMTAMLDDIAAEALAIQQAKTPVDEGNLRSGLSAQVEGDRLRVRIGLLGTQRGRSKLFYGRPVDRGVRAQTVLVQRRRRVKGKLRTQARGSRKRASDIVAIYSLRVKPRPGTFFIEAPDLGAIADPKIDAFWSRLEQRAGGGQ